VLKKAMGGVLFIDEAYYLYRPENERDYGQEAIEILLQVMEDNRDDLVVILAGYKDRMDTFFKSNPGMASRIAHHIDFPDYAADELFRIAELMFGTMNYRFDAEAVAALRDYIVRRMEQPRFANARAIRNALDRARLRQANRLFAERLLVSRREANHHREANQLRVRQGGRQLHAHGRAVGVGADVLLHGGILLPGAVGRAGDGRPRGHDVGAREEGPVGEHVPAVSRGEAPPGRPRAPQHHARPGRAHPPPPLPGQAGCPSGSATGSNTTDLRRSKRPGREAR